MTAETVYDALWPGGPPGVPMTPAAARPVSLAGKRVAYLWDYMFRGDEIFPVLHQGLAERFGAVEAIGHERFGSVFGGDEEAVLAALPATLREMGVDAVVSGIGC